jgi:hypothetical protein
MNFTEDELALLRLGVFVADDETGVVEVEGQPAAFPQKVAECYHGPKFAPLIAKLLNRARSEQCGAEAQTVTTSFAYRSPATKFIELGPAAIEAGAQRLLQAQFYCGDASGKVEELDRGVVKSVLEAMVTASSASGSR